MASNFNSPARPRANQAGCLLIIASLFLLLLLLLLQVGSSSNSLSSRPFDRLRASRRSGWREAGSGPTNEWRRRRRRQKNIHSVVEIEIEAADAASQPSSETRGTVIASYELAIAMKRGAQQ